MKKQQAQLSYERPPDDDYEEKAKTLGFVPLSRGSSAAERIEAQINMINASSNAADSAWNSVTLHGDADDDFNQMHNPGSVDPTLSRNANAWGNPSDLLTGQGVVLADADEVDNGWKIIHDDVIPPAPKVSAFAAAASSKAVKDATEKMSVVIKLERRPYSVSDKPLHDDVREESKRRTAENLKKQQLRLRDGFSLSRWWSKNQPWVTKFKYISNKFGKTTGIYFYLARWTLYFNLCLGILWIGAVVVPTFNTYPSGVIGAPTDLIPKAPVSSSVGEIFTGLYTGSGVFNYSALFVGAYFIPYKKLAVPGSEPMTWDIGVYDLTIIYLLTLFVFLLVALIGIFREFYKAYKEWIIETPDLRTDTAKGFYYPMAHIVLCSFDFKIEDPKKLALEKLRLIFEINEDKTVIARKKAYKASAYINLFKKCSKEYNEKTNELEVVYYQFPIRTAKRIMVNLICSGILAGMLYFLYVLVQKYSTSTIQFERSIPTFTLSAANIIIPTIFFKLAEKFEDHENDVVLFQVQILRTMVLRLAGLVVFFSTLFSQSITFMCWENFIGQYVYQVYIVGFGLEIILSSLTEPLRKFFGKIFGPCFVRSFGLPHFELGGAISELMFNQSYIIFGTFFCPMLPLLAAVRLMIIINIKSFIVSSICVFHRAKTLGKVGASFRVLFYGFLLLMFFFGTFPLAYFLTYFASSGVYFQSGYHDRWVTPVALNLFNNTHVTPNVTITQCATPTTASTMACSDCLLAYTFNDTICWNPTSAGNTTVQNPGFWFKNGINITKSALCAACPSGCGPFRNAKSVYASLQTKLQKFPAVVLAGMDYFATTTVTVLILSCLAMGNVVQLAKVRSRYKVLKNEKDGLITQLIMETKDLDFLRLDPRVKDIITDFNDFNKKLEERRLESFNEEDEDDEDD